MPRHLLKLIFDKNGILTSLPVYMLKIPIKKSFSLFNPRWLIESQGQIKISHSGRGLRHQISPTRHLIN